jgi:hypothetical protein
MLLTSKSLLKNACCFLTLHSQNITISNSISTTPPAHCTGLTTTETSNLYAAKHHSCPTSPRSDPRMSQTSHSLKITSRSFLEDCYWHVIPSATCLSLQPVVTLLFNGDFRQGTASSLLVFSQDCNITYWFRKFRYVDSGRMIYSPGDGILCSACYLEEKIPSWYSRWSPRV